MKKLAAKFGYNYNVCTDWEDVGIAMKSYPIYQYDYEDWNERTRLSVWLVV